MSNHVRKDKEDGRKGWAMAFVVVSLFCIIFFAARGRFQAPVSSQAVSLVLSPFQQATAWVANEIHYATSAVWEVATLYEQNKMLRNEVEQLRGINLQANEALAENERLRKMIGYQQAARQFDFVAARVIGRESDTWSRMIVIDRGTMNGIANDMPVVTPQGLVGRVVEAGLNSSKVQLILDPRSSVGTIVQRAESRVTGIVQGDMDNPTMPQMVNIPKNADVVEGDVISLEIAPVKGIEDIEPQKMDLDIIYEDDNEYTMWKQLDLRPQNTWKPSDEQIEALHDAIIYVKDSMFPSKNVLKKLYGQLKKLREV